MDYIYISLTIKKINILVDSVHPQQHIGILKNIIGLVPDHHNKTNITKSKSSEFFGLPVHTKIMFTLHCRL